MFHLLQPAVSVSDQQVQQVCNVHPTQHSFSLPLDLSSSNYASTICAYLRGFIRSTFLIEYSKLPFETKMIRNFHVEIHYCSGTRNLWIPLHSAGLTHLCHSFYCATFKI